MPSWSRDDWEESVLEVFLEDSVLFFNVIFNFYASRFYSSR